MEQIFLDPKSLMGQPPFETDENIEDSNEDVKAPRFDDDLGEYIRDFNGRTCFECVDKNKKIWNKDKRLMAVYGTYPIDGDDLAELIRTEGVKTDRRILELKHLEYINKTQKRVLTEMEHRNDPNKDNVDIQHLERIKIKGSGKGSLSYEPVDNSSENVCFIQDDEILEPGEFTKLLVTSEK